MSKRSTLLFANPSILNIGFLNRLKPQLSSSKSERRDDILQPLQKYLKEASCDIWQKNLNLKNLSNKFSLLSEKYSGDEAFWNETDTRAYLVSRVVFAMREFLDILHGYIPFKAKTLNGVNEGVVRVSYANFEKKYTDIMSFLSSISATEQASAGKMLANFLDKELFVFLESLHFEATLFAQKNKLYEDFVMNICLLKLILVVNKNDKFDYDYHFFEDLRTTLFLYSEMARLQT